MKTAPLFLMLAAGAAAGSLDGLTPLQQAIHGDDLSAAKSLLASGASANQANRYGVTPLILACTNANQAMVNLLLDAGADANAPVRGRDTPLITAARSGKPGIVRALLARGAQPDVANESGNTPLMWAAAEGHAETAQVLIAAGADLRARLESGLTPLMLAARQGHIPAVQALLKAGAPIDDPVVAKARSSRRSPRRGYTALNIAIENGHFELASFLLDAGANPGGGNVGFNTLHQLTWVRKTNRGEDHDPVPEITGGMTSLDMVRKLVAKGVDINAPTTQPIRGLSRLNYLGATAFFMAARTADSEYMQLLADLGADPLKPNADGTTPIMAASGLGTLSPGEDPGTPEESLVAVQLAHKLGANLDTVDANGDTAMHGAAYKNLPGVVEYLASAGANIKVWHTRNKQGWTPLTIAEGHRFGNFKPSPDTIAAFHKVMLAAGVKPVSDGNAKGAQIY